VLQIRIRNQQLELRNHRLELELRNRKLVLGFRTMHGEHVAWPKDQLDRRRLVLVRSKLVLELLRSKLELARKLELVLVRSRLGLERCKLPCVPLA
jgi:hypothetical protein